MQLKDFDQICVLISTLSKNYKEIEKKIIKKLDTCLDGDSHTIILSQDSKTIEESARKYAKEYDNPLIIAVGGDGSLSEAINGIRDSKATFAFLPNGTGNDFSRTVYPNLSIEEIIDKMDTLEVKDIDVIKVNDEYAINSFSFGFESQILEKSLKIKPKLGRFKSMSIILSVLLIVYKLKYFRYDYQYTLADNSQISGEVERYVTAICNGKYFGTGFMPAPNAKIDDGILNLNGLKVESFPKLLNFLSKYKSDKHMELDHSENIEIISGHIKSKEGKMIGNIDGNIRYFDEIDFEVLKNRIKLGKFIG